MIQRLIIALAGVMLVAMLVYGFAENASTGRVDEAESLDLAIEQADLEDKMVLIDFYTTWCPPCKKFTKHSKNNREMQETLADVVVLKVDCESEEGRELAQLYKIKSYPTFVVMSSSGKIESRWSGYGKDHFLKHLEDAIYE